MYKTMRRMEFERKWCIAVCLLIGGKYPEFLEEIPDDNLNCSNRDIFVPKVYSMPKPGIHRNYYEELAGYTIDEMAQTPHGTSMGTVDLDTFICGSPTRRLIWAYRHGLLSHLSE